MGNEYFQGFSFHPTLFSPLLLVGQREVCCCWMAKPLSMSVWKMFPFSFSLSSPLSLLSFFGPIILVSLDTKRGKHLKGLEYERGSKNLSFGVLLLCFAQQQKPTPR